MTTEQITFTLEQRNRLGRWLSECLDDDAPLNEHLWAGRADWMTKGQTFQAVIQQIVAEAKAEAWEEGFTAGFYDPLGGANSTRDASESTRENPYRAGGES